MKAIDDAERAVNRLAALGIRPPAPTPTTPPKPKASTGPKPGNKKTAMREWLVGLVSKSPGITRQGIIDHSADAPTQSVDRNRAVSNQINACMAAQLIWEDEKGGMFPGGGVE